MHGQPAYPAIAPILSPERTPFRSDNACSMEPAYSTICSCQGNSLNADRPLYPSIGCAIGYTYATSTYPHILAVTLSHFARRACGPRYKSALPLPSSSMSSSRSSSSKSSSSNASSSSSRSSSSSSKSAKPRTAAQIRQADHLEYITGLLKSHASYMGQPIMSLSASVSLTPTELSGVLALIYFFLHLVLPAFLLPHLSALVTLVIPLKNTLVSVAKEIKGKKNEDCAQWSWYWVVYGLLGLVRGGLGIWRPGWRGAIEIVRSGALICVGGPWFGNAGLKPPPPSEELVKQEKAEAAEQNKERDKAEREKTKADKKQAEQTKSDVKARERDAAKERAQREKDSRRK